LLIGPEEGDYATEFSPFSLSFQLFHIVA